MPKSERKKIVASVPSVAAKLKLKPAATIEVLVFLLDREEYAIPILDAREIIPMSKITPVPNTPAFMRGILNLRGKIVVVIDLEKCFGLRREHPVAPKHIIVVEVSGTAFGVIVDVVRAVLPIPPTQIHKTSALASRKIPSRYWQGVVERKQPERKPKAQGRRQDQPEASQIPLLNLTKLLQDKELGHFPKDLSPPNQIN